MTTDTLRLAARDTLDGCVKDEIIFMAVGHHPGQPYLLYEKVVDHIYAALLRTRRAALEEAAGVAENCRDFTGANYCDIHHPDYDPNRVHDYGRGGNDARRVLAAAIRALAEKE